MIYKLPLILAAQPEGGYTVTCPFLPELITEGDSVRQAVANAEDALAAVIEGYHDLGRPLPVFLQPLAPTTPLWLETALTAA
jgi:antitoxin HicB